LDAQAPPEFARLAKAILTPPTLLPLQGEGWDGDGSDLVLVFSPLEREAEKIPTYNGYEQKVVTIWRLATACLRFRT